MQTVKVSEFKAKYLHLMDEAGKTGEEIVMTKNGKPVSILKAYMKPPLTLLGRQKNNIKSCDDLVASVDVLWDSE